MSFDCAAARALIRAYRAGASTLELRVGAVRELRGPSEAARPSEVMVDDDSISVLLRNAVGQHAGAAEAVLVNDGHIGTELRGDKGGLVAAWTAAENRDAWTWQSHVSNYPVRSPLGCTPPAVYSRRQLALPPPYLQHSSYRSAAKTAIVSAAKTPYA